jgi:radical SAM protein with 4Fe4S-binding SPASM domain
MTINQRHAEEIIEFLHQLGIRTFAMNGMIYSGGGAKNPLAIPEEEMPPILLRVRDKAEELGMRFLWYTPTEYCRMSPVELEIGAKRCNAGEYSLCIEPNGDVLPCQSYYLSAGNILRDPWDEIWNGDLFRSFRDREEDPQAAGLPEKCWECPQLPICGGGCRIEREAREGTVSHDGIGAGGCSGCHGCSTSEPTAVPLQTGFVGPVREGRGTTLPDWLVDGILDRERRIGRETEERVASQEGAGAAACSGCTCGSASGPTALPLQPGIGSTARDGRGEKVPLELIESSRSDEDEIRIAAVDSPGDRLP